MTYSWLSQISILLDMWWFQGPIPPTPTSSMPWWQAPEGQFPYLLIVILVVIGFILGGLARPLISNAGYAILHWVQGLGKYGDFRQRYLSEIVSRCRHLALLPANVVAARWEYRRRAIELEDLYTPLSLGEERVESGLDNPEVAFRSRKQAGGKTPPNKLLALWWQIKPPIEPVAGSIGEIIEDHQRLIIRGDLGSGKTTLLRFLAITCARSLRNNRRDGDGRKITRIRLGWRNNRIHFLVRLGAFSDVTSWRKDKRLLDAIIDTLLCELNLQPPPWLFVPCRRALLNARKARLLSARRLHLHS